MLMFAELAMVIGNCDVGDEDGVERNLQGKVTEDRYACDVS